MVTCGRHSWTSQYYHSAFKPGSATIILTPATDLRSKEGWEWGAQNLPSFHSLPAQLLSQLGLILEYKPSLEKRATVYGEVSHAWGLVVVPSFSSGFLCILQSPPPQRLLLKIWVSTQRASLDDASLPKQPHVVEDVHAHKVCMFQPLLS